MAAINKLNIAGTIYDINAIQTNNSDTIDNWHNYYFYNEMFGSRWYHLNMTNTSSSLAGYYKIADIKMQSGYGSYTAAKIIGYYYDHQGNWEQSETLKIPFQCIVNITGDGAALYTEKTYGTTQRIRLVKLDTRHYELQAGFYANHCDYDVFFQVVSGNGVTPHDTLVSGSTTGTVLTNRPLTCWDDCNSFSTTEIPIGTWIDGKTIYRKVFTLISSTTTWGAGTIKTINCGTNLDTIIKCDVITSGNNNTNKEVNKYIYAERYSKTSGTYEFNCSSGYSIQHAYVILEYTKD